MSGESTRFETTCLIRPEVPGDRLSVFAVNSQAFGRDDEANLVNALRDGGYARVSLVAEVDSHVVGHILFSEMSVVRNGASIRALALAPMEVRPAKQRTGIGSALVRRGLESCRAQPHQAVIVLGHPAFYPKFGFSATAASQVEAPFSGDAFMALRLDESPGWDLAGKAVYAPPFAIP